MVDGHHSEASEAAITRTAKAEAAAAAAAAEAAAAAKEAAKMRREWDELEEQRSALQDEVLAARQVGVE